jgi:hypothetical protein
MLLAAVPWRTRSNKRTRRVCSPKVPGTDFERCRPTARMRTWPGTPAGGWECRLPVNDTRRELLNLYLPICSATLRHPVTVGHLGQSLDGFHRHASGDSRFVTGDDNLVHVHRMRALCDAVVVGAGTVAADDPQLTTRHVPGPSPLRVVIDPGRRLETHVQSLHRSAGANALCLRTDASFYLAKLCRRRDGRRYRRGRRRHGGRAGDAVVAGAGLARACWWRGAASRCRRSSRRSCSIVFRSRLLPVFIGEGRPAIRLAPQTHLRDCLRPGYRVYRMGGDVLFDCELNARTERCTVARREASVA